MATSCKISFLHNLGHYSCIQGFEKIIIVLIFVYTCFRCHRGGCENIMFGNVNRCVVKSTYPSSSNGVFETLNDILSHNTRTRESFGPPLQNSFCESQLLKRETEGKAKCQSFFINFMFLFEIIRNNQLCLLTLLTTYININVKYVQYYPPS